MADQSGGPVRFEDKLQELEAIVRKLETGDLTLEEAMEHYERGVKLSESCEKELQDAETKVEILQKKGNQVVAEAFPPDKA